MEIQHLNWLSNELHESGLYEEWTKKSRISNGNQPAFTLTKTKMLIDLKVENTQEHYEYFKHGPTIALLVPCSIRQIRTLLTFRGSNTDSIPHLVLAEIGHSQIQNRPLTKTAPLGLKRCPDALLFES